MRLLRRSDQYNYYVAYGKCVTLIVFRLWTPNDATRESEHMKKRILLVDDEPDFLEMTQMRLEANEFHVTTAGNGSDALAAARKLRPDIILLDINMPDMDGGDVAELIRRTPQLKDTPIVFLTALVSDREAAASRASGDGEKFLSKTDGSDTILAYVNQTLNIPA